MAFPAFLAPLAALFGGGAAAAAAPIAAAAAPIAAAGTAAALAPAAAGGLTALAPTAAAALKGGAALKAVAAPAAAAAAAPAATAGGGIMGMLGLGAPVKAAPAGAGLAGNLAGADVLAKKAGMDAAIQAKAAAAQSSLFTPKNMMRFGKAAMNQGSAPAAPAPMNPEVQRGNRQQSGGIMGTLPQQSAESPGMKLFSGSPQMNPMTPQMNPMMPMPMSQVNFREGGYIEGPGTGRSDSIPATIYQDGRPVQEARLSDGEFVMTENAVRGAGDGDRAEGAARLYRMMREFEKGGRVHGRA